MLKKKLRVAVIFGGTNTEHEVSLVSALSVITHLDPTKYEVLPVMITKNNQWLASKNLLSDHTQITYLPETIKAGNILQPQTIQDQFPIDIYFPVLHGPYGEDGTIQGLLELMHVPYVGAGVLASALCMDKAVQKQLCAGAGLPVAGFELLTSPSNLPAISYPVFVKPANQGSSVGVVKVHNEKELLPAVKQAFKLDTKILIEQAIPHAREIECAVLGTTDHPEVSLPGEIVSSNEFYDYDAKYVDGKSQANIPAYLPKKIIEKIQEIAAQAFIITNCYGLARVDFLVNGKTNEIFLNELNTMPGFTTISMYPKLWEASGLSYAKLLDTLIQLAMKRHQQKLSLTYSFAPKKTWYSPTTK